MSRAGTGVDSKMTSFSFIQRRKRMKLKPSQLSKLKYKVNLGGFVNGVVFGDGVEFARMQ